MKKVPDRSAMDAELMRDVLGAAAHDLGGAASALGLRLDALGSAPSPEERKALASIAEEVRVLGRQLRQLRGPKGSETLAPGRNTSLRTWWPLIERFGRAVLGRGVALEGLVQDCELTPAPFHALTYAVLGLCRDVREREMSPATLTITGERSGSTLVVRLRLTAGAEDIAFGDGSTPWGAYARETAGSVGARLDAAPDAVTITLEVA
jgi:hypothetical protein